MVWKLVGLVAVFVLAFAVVQAEPAQSQVPSLTERVRVFVQFNNGANAGDVAQVQNLGGQARYSFLGGRVISFEVPAFVAEILARKPEFSVRPVPPVSAIEDTLPWGIDQVNAEHVWGGAEDAVNVTPGANDGSGAVIAVVDTGIATHSDLNIIGGTSFVSGNSSYYDDNGHGTHVSGIAAARDNGSGVIGIAPGAGLLAVKVLNSQGSGYLDDVAKGIEWAAATAPT